MVNTLDRVVSDPQITARGMVASLEAADGRRPRVIGDPLRLARRDRRPARYPPALGEDSRTVLAEVLGLGADEIETLVAKVWSGRDTVHRFRASGSGELTRTPETCCPWLSSPRS